MSEQSYEKSLLADLKAREEALFESSTRKDRDRVASMLTDDFCEFGSSGRAFGKVEILDALADETPQHLIAIDYRLTVLAPGAVLLTYRATRQVAATVSRSSLRSSIWVRQGESWKMRFHQGTPIP